MGKRPQPWLRIDAQTSEWRNGAAGEGRGSELCEPGGLRHQAGGASWKGPPLGPGGEDITWPDQVAPRGRKASSTRKIKPQTSNLKPQVVHSDIGPRSCLLSCEPLALPWPGESRMGMTLILVILASSPRLANPWRPDAGTSEGTRLGEGSREFVLEGRRVSCFVPTCGGSGQGVNFGVFRANISLG